MTKSKGVSLGQYTIIIILVALCLVPLLIVIGQNIVSNFENFYNGLKQQKPYQNTNNKLVTGGSLGGTPSNPVQKCVDGTCTIDYGEFVLNGIPENFQNYVQANGTSGGTENLLSLVEQIADQLKQDGDVAGSDEIKDLANYGHKLSSAVAHWEDIAKACNNNRMCLLRDPTRSDFAYTDGALQPGIAPHEQLKRVAGIGFSRMAKINNYPNDGSYSYQFVNKYDNIINNPKYSDAKKGVLKELYWSVGILGETFTAKVRSTAFGLNTYANNDPLTGAPRTPGNIDINDVLNFLVAPETSAVTNLDSALICASGHNFDTGTSCH